MKTATIGTYLMYKNQDNWEKLIDIVNYPDLGGKPEKIDVTTLSDKMEQSILGVQKLDTLEFEVFYTLEDYKKLKALENKQLDLGVWFGYEDDEAKGKDGKMTFKGTLAVMVKGGAVNEARKMTLTVAVQSEIKNEA